MALVTLAVFIPNLSPLAMTPIVLIGIIVVPGILLAFILKIFPDKIPEYFLYAIGLGLGFALAGGLGINWILPLFGIYHPLAKISLIIFFDISVFVLSAAAYYFNKDYVTPWTPRWPNKTSIFFGVFPWLFVILSIYGAAILNNGGSGTLTLVMLFGIALYVLAAACFRRSIQGWAYISALYSIGLSLLLMYSLRSTHILGWEHQPGIPGIPNDAPKPPMENVLLSWLGL